MAYAPLTYNTHRITRIAKRTPLYTCRTLRTHALRRIAPRRAPAARVPVADVARVAHARRVVGDRGARRELRRSRRARGARRARREPARVRKGSWGMANHNAAWSHKKNDSPVAHWLHSESPGPLAYVPLAQFSHVG